MATINLIKYHSFINLTRILKLFLSTKETNNKAHWEYVIHAEQSINPNVLGRTSS